MDPLAAAPLLKELFALPPDKVVWTDFERNFLHEITGMMSRVDDFRLTEKQSNILIRTYYKHILVPKAPAPTAEKKAELEARYGKGKGAKPASRSAVTTPPRRRDMQDVNALDEPPF